MGVELVPQSGMPGFGTLRAELGIRPARPIGELARPELTALPVHPGLAEILPHGFRRGSTIALTSSVSLALAMLSGPSTHGAWTALVGMPDLNAEAAAEAGLELSRLAIIRPPATGWNGASWVSAVGHLLDAVDIVLARLDQSSGRITDGDARRLTARARSKDAVLMLFGPMASSWPAAEVRLSAKHEQWSGIGEGYGRLTARQLTVAVTGKGRSAQPRRAQLWLPFSAGPVMPIGQPLMPSTDLPLSAVG